MIEMETGNEAGNIGEVDTTLTEEEINTWGEFLHVVWPV